MVQWIETSNRFVVILNRKQQSLLFKTPGQEMHFYPSYPDALSGTKIQEWFLVS